jgi:hypothetical protein
MWADIATRGREAGRPSQHNHQIMRLEPQDMAEEGVFGLHDCELEPYSHQDLVAQGGFNRANKAFLYKHRELHTERTVDRRISKLRMEMKKRKRAEDELEEEGDAARTRIVTPKKTGSTKGERGGTTVTKTTRIERVVKKPRKS